VTFLRVYTGNNKAAILVYCYGFYVTMSAL